MTTSKFSQKLSAIRGSFNLILVLLVFGLIYSSCGEPYIPPVPKPVVEPAPLELSDTTQTEDDTIILTNDDPVTEIGEAHFFNDSIEVIGDGFEFRKHVSYGRVLILFDEDNKIIKVETLESLPFKQVNKNTIYLLKGANLTMVSRHYGIPLQKLIDCNPSLRNPNNIPAMTYLKLNCE